jgi:hypothetical protein
MGVMEKMDAVLIVCKFMMEGLVVASTLAQLKIRSIRYDYNEKAKAKPKLIFLMNGIAIEFNGQIARHLKKLFENPFEEFFMADFCDEDTDANKKEYDKFFKAFERANTRISLNQQLQPFSIYQLILVDGYSVKVNPDYAHFFRQQTPMAITSKQQTL